MTALVVVMAMVTGGCGDHAGNGVSDPVVDLSQLDVGPYDPEPHPLPAPKNAAEAALYEGIRLGNVLPLASDIDPKFKYSGIQSGLVLGAGPDVKNDFVGALWADDQFSEDAPGYIGGYTTYGTDSPHTLGNQLVNAVMIFGNEQQATTAAAAFSARAFSDSHAGIYGTPTDAYGNQLPDTANEELPIAKYPGAHAHWKSGWQQVHSWYPTGKFVVYTGYRGQADLKLGHANRTVLTQFVSDSLDHVVPALQKFTPTPPDQLMSVPVDPEKMLERMMRPPRGDSDDAKLQPVVYNAHTQLNFESDQEVARARFDRDGIDLIADYMTVLYRTRDSAAALEVRDELGGPHRHNRAAAPPKGLPPALCREDLTAGRMANRFYCAVKYGRYATMSWSNQLTDAQQRISAQYEILVKTK
ncbi:DUF7373 family lipoprotein [Nocardia stercoris]|uniref:DUF7373 family lipoprotein n=1 Tax=Nocardia stercoris TaxID=2483361 RepID=UPI0011C34BD6|nr:hypothetical protein [Nocardia stercoris]